jgi:hypothetical protein
VIQPHGRGDIAPTELVRRLVDEVINGGELDVLEELCTPTLAPKLRRAFEQFRSALPGLAPRGA